MAPIHVRGEDGAWRPLGSPRSLAVWSDGRRVTFHVAANVPARVLVRLPEGRYDLRTDSDAVTVSLADDATWQHMRGLLPSPETLEGC